MEVRTGDNKVDPHSLASLLACFYSDVAPWKDEPTGDGNETQVMLASIVSLLAQNPKLCNATTLPPLDTNGFEFDSSNPDVVWRVRSLDADNDELEPLGRLLEKLMEWIRTDDKEISWPTYASEPERRVNVDAKVDSRGLFARRHSGKRVTDSSCNSRRLEKPNAAALADAMKGRINKNALASDAPIRPLQKLLDQGKFTVPERMNLRTRNKLGYDIESHERPLGHSHAMAVVKRIEKDINAYHEKKSQDKHRFPDIAKGFEDIMATLQGKAADAKAFKKASDAASKAKKAMGNLESTLREQQKQEMGLVSESIDILVQLANDVDMPNPNQTKSEALETDALARYRFALFKLSGQEAAIDFNFLVMSLMSSKMTEEWCGVNPFIRESLHDDLQRLLVAVLLLASGIAHINQVMHECTKLQRMLQGLIDKLDKSENANEAVLGIVNLADSVASSLHVVRHYVDVDRSHVYDPRLLVFEFIRAVILRGGQVTLVQDFIIALDQMRHVDVSSDATPQKNLAQQMLMGQGKTAIITPLLCLLLADGKRQPIVMLPDPLLEAGRDIVRTTFSNVIAKRVYTLLCTRANVADPRFLTKLQSAMHNRGVIMTTPGSIKSIMLKFLEAAVGLSDDNASRKTVGSGRPLSRRQRATLVNDVQSWGQLLEAFQRCVLIMDELDWITNPMKSELNFPIGLKSPLDLGPLEEGKRWEVPLHLWDGLFAAETQVPPTHLKNNPQALVAIEQLFLVLQAGFSQGSMQRRPHIILLDRVFYSTLVLPALVDWMLIFLQGQRVGASCSQELLCKCLRGESMADAERTELASLPHTEQKIVKLSRDWLTTFFPYCATHLHTI